MRLLLTILLAFSLQGCILFKTDKPDATLPPPERTVRIAAEALERCKAQITAASKDVILDTIATNTEIYNDCATKQDNSIKLLKQFGNIKDAPSN